MSISVFPNGQKQPVTIPSGSSVSNAISTCNARGMDIKLTAGWTEADIGFDLSDDGENWYPRVDAEGNRVKATGVSQSENRAISCPAEMWGGGVWPFVRLVSLDVSNETAENQGAARNMEVKFYA